LFAWEYADAGFWQDAQSLEKYEASGKPIRVAAASGQDDLELTMIPLRE
jgi:hypothetical protein